jgi:hypothetical protein
MSAKRPELVAKQRRLIAKLNIDDRNTRNRETVMRAEILLALFEQQRNLHFSRWRRLADQLQIQSTPDATGGGIAAIP